MAFPFDPTEYIKESLKARLQEQQCQERSIDQQKATKGHPRMQNKFNQKPVPVLPPPSNAIIKVDHKRSVSIAQGPRFLPKDYSDTASLSLDGDRSSIDNDAESKQVYDPALSSSASSFRLAGSNGKKRRVKELEGNRSVIDLASMLRIVPSEEIPAEPIRSQETRCCGVGCNRYHVSKSLDENYELQSRFFKYISIGFVIQILTIIGWVVVVSQVGELDTIMKNNFSWSYIPLGLFFLSKIYIRVETRIRKTHPVFQLILLVLRTLCLAYYCGAVKAASMKMGSVISISLCILLQTSAFFAWTSNYVAYDVTNLEIVGTAAVPTTVFSLTMLITLVIYSYEQQILTDVVVLNWIPSVISCEVISMCVMFEIRQIVRGFRFPLTQGDWMFAILYV